MSEAQDESRREVGREQLREDAAQERRRDPGPTGKQYQADQENSRLRNILAGWALGGITALLALNLYGTFIKTPADRKQADQKIRLSQYEGCVDGANGLRQQVRTEFVDFKEKAVIPVYAGVAATIPEGATSKTILEDSVAYLNKRIDTIGQRIPNVHCRVKYPPLEDQTFPSVQSIRDRD